MPVLAALPDIAVAAAGVVMLIIGYGLYLLADVLTGGFRHVPLIGGWVASHLGGAVRDAGDAVMRSADAAFHGAEGLFRVVETWVLNVLNVITWAAKSAGDALANIVEVQLPRLRAAAWRDTSVALANARGFTGWLWGHLGHEISAGLHAVTALTWHLYGELRADIANAESAATSWAARRVDTAVTDLERRADQAVSVAWRGADGDVEALRRLIGRDYQSWQHLLPLLEGAAGAGLAGALARALAGSALAVKAIDECVVPNCDNLGKFGKDIAELGSAGAAAAMLAWLAYVATDPVAAANDTVTVAGPLTDAVFAPLVSLVSAATEHL